MPPARPSRSFGPRKLLVAAIGVATINYVGACGNNETSGNLPAPRPMDASSELPPTSGNLPAPVYPDASTDADAADATDAADDAADAADAADDADAG